MNIIFTILGSSMAFWYWCYRWTLFADKIKYAWAYMPMNLFTAFTSVVFLTPTLFRLDLLFGRNWQLFFICCAIFLLGRNLYYTLEDIIDYPTNPRMQSLDITIDVLMAIYCFLYIFKTLRGLYGG